MLSEVVRRAQRASARSRSIPIPFRLQPRALEAFFRTPGLHPNLPFPAREFRLGRDASTPPEDRFALLWLRSA
jgi:hypothetical protein